MNRSASHVCLFFFFLITAIIQVPVTSWAQDTVAPESKEGVARSFQQPKNNNPRQLKIRPRALQQRRENRRERRQDFRQNRRENRQDRRQNFRENRRGKRGGAEFGEKEELKEGLGL